MLLTTIVALMMLVGVSSAAATWTVTTTADTPLGDGDCLPGSCSLRQAINASSAGDTVILPASSTPYSVSGGQLFVQSAITIEGAGTGSSVIDATAGNDDRVMLVYGNAAAVRLEDLTITGGDTSATMKTGGGGIAAGGPGPLVLDDVDVVGNTVDTTNAGSAFNEGGGGIYSLTSVALDDSTVSDNTVNVPASDGDSGGGGILMAQTTDNSDNLTVTDSTVSDNTATVAPSGTGDTDANGGGDLYEDGGDLSVIGSLIQDNTAAVSSATPNTLTPTDGGGGIYQFGNQFLLEDSTVAGNVAHGPGIDRGGGGGVLDSGNASQYLNSTITQNSTDEPAAGDDSDGGGGVLLNNVKDGVTFANMTIDGNSAPESTGGGINNNLDTSAGVSDSILAGNMASGTHGDCAGPILSEGYNLTDDPGENNSCSLTAPGDIVGANPGLGPLADNGGPTPTEALLAGSPAIGGGNPAGCSDLLGDPISTDQRGVSRAQPAGGSCDLGAYEVALPMVSTGPATVAGSSVVLQATAGEPDPRPGTLSFQYGPTVTYGSSTVVQPLTGLAAPQTFIAAVRGLAPGTYHFRAVASDPDGTSVGSDGIFTISAQAVPPSVPPSVTTRSAARLKPFSVTLRGRVGPAGEATRWRFEYGTLASGRYGRSSAAHSLSPAAGASEVSASVTGLRAGRTYHYRLVASNATGTTVGSGERFRTSRKPRPRALTARVTPHRDAAAPYSYLVTGGLSLPGGLTRPLGCRGTVIVRAMVGFSTVGRSKAGVRRSCLYRVEVRLRDMPATTRGRARIDVSFTGTAWLAPRDAARLVVGFG